MEIAIPQPDKPDIFSYGFDKSLNREIPSGNNPTVYDTVENAINTGSILVGNLSAARLNIGGFNSTAGITIYSEPSGQREKLQTLKIDGANSDLVEGGDISITAGKGGDGYNGANTFINGGTGGSSDGTGGEVHLQGGTGGLNHGYGGQVIIAGGNASGAGSGGKVIISAGGADTGVPGEIQINGGSGSTFTNNISITGGAGTSTGATINSGDVRITGGGGVSGIPAVNANGGHVILSGGRQADTGTDGFVKILDPSSNFNAILDTTKLATNKTFSFPNKTGMFALIGTFAVQLPAVAATTSVFSTVVSVSGIRIEDALTITRSDQGVSAAYATPTTAKIFYSAIPGNGQITMNFINLGAATGYTEHTFSYSAGSSAQ